MQLDLGKQGWKEDLGRVRHKGAEQVACGALSQAGDACRFGVLTHPIDDQVRAFYMRFGFETLPFDPERSMVVCIVDLERGGF